METGCSTNTRGMGWSWLCYQAFQRRKFSQYRQCHLWRSRHDNDYSSKRLVLVWSSIGVARDVVRYVALSLLAVKGHKAWFLGIND